MTTDLQKPLHIYITHTRENPKASSGAGRTRFSFLPWILFCVEESGHDMNVTGDGCGCCRGGSVQGAPASSRWSPATAPAREKMLLPLHVLLLLILTNRSGELDYSDTVKLYLLVLELCNTKNEKTRNLTAVFSNFARSPAQQFRHERFRLLR